MTYYRFYFQGLRGYFCFDDRLFSLRYAGYANMYRVKVIRDQKTCIRVYHWSCHDRPWLRLINIKRKFVIQLALGHVPFSSTLNDDSCMKRAVCNGNKRNDRTTLVTETTRFCMRLTKNSLRSSEVGNYVLKCFDEISTNYKLSKENPTC